jgi:transcriptional regulator with XRE-family HTH domain
MSHTDLGAFLKAQRGHTRPHDVALTALPGRRVPGLRREEVAMLAGVSVDYYTRLEQGRERNPSPAVLNAIAGALNLDDDLREHIFRLADLAPSPRQALPESIDPALKELLGSWAHTPALIINRRLDILAANDLANALYSDFARADNIVRMTFIDPVGRGFFAEWQRAAETCVANLRLALGHASGHDAVLALVAEVHEASAEFRMLWARHNVRGKTREAKAFHHGDVGDLLLDYIALDIRSAPGQQLVVYQAPAGTSSADKLRLLGTLSATSRLGDSASRPAR